MHFTLLVFSVDSMMGRETEAFVKRLEKHLAIKWDSLFSCVIDYLLTRLSIVCARTNHLTLCGLRIPVHNMSYMLPQFDNGTDISLMYYQNFIHPQFPSTWLIVAYFHLG